jgi:transposase, IS5 family
VDAACAPVQIIHRGKFKSLDAQQRKWLKRRQAIEPAIGHTKSDNRMDRCWLGGSSGDALHAVLCAAGFNIRWLLRAIAAKGLVALLLALSQMALYAACIGNALRNPTLATGQTNRRFDWRHAWITPSLATA